MLVAAEFWYGSAAYVVTTFYRVKVLSHSNNDDKLLELQSKYNFEAFLLSVIQNRFLPLISFATQLCDVYGTPERINARK